MCNIIIRDDCVVKPYYICIMDNVGDESAQHSKHNFVID